MILTNASKQMENRALEIFRASESQLCKIKHRIFSEDNEDVSVSPQSVATANIAQLFESQYGDRIGVTLDVSVEEALLLMTNYQNLRYTITFNHVTQHYYTIIDSIPPETKKFRVEIDNAMDILKTLQKAEVTTSEEKNTTNEQHKPDDIRARRFNLQIGLITEDLYKIREVPFHFPAVNCKLIDVIHAAANIVGIKKVKMTKHPENEKVFQHTPVTPDQTFGTFFDSLHETYGGYQKGLEYYYIDEVLYVYPGFDTNPDTEKILHLYRLPKGSFGGCKSYHSVDDDGNIHVVLVDEVVLQNLSEIGIESVGNYQLARRSDAGLDVDVVMNGKDAEIRPTNLISVAAQNEKAIAPGRVSTKYVPTTNNALAMSSEMSGVMCKLMTTVWRMAWPWLLLPGMKIIYHYEEMNGLKTTTGILSGVEYSIERLSGIVGQHYSYAWSAQLLGRLSPDEQDEEKISTDMLASLRNQKT